MIDIGPYKLSSVETGEFALDGGAMFGIIPKPLWEKRIETDNRNRIDLRLRALLIQDDKRNILVDTGIGDKGDGKFNDIYRVDHTRFNLDKSLSEKKLARTDITDVILTHLHFDHAGGATFIHKGDIAPTFPNATYHIQKQQLETAINPSKRERGSFIRGDFEPLVKNGLTNIIDGERELFPGIVLYTTNGHTAAQQQVFVSDGKKHLFHTADMIPTSVHIGVHWIMGYDVRPLNTLKEREHFLEKACLEGWILFFGHCPHMPAATVKFTEKRYQIFERVDV